MFIELTNHYGHKVLLNICKIATVEPTTRGCYVDTVGYAESYEEVKAMINLWIAPKFIVGGLDEA
jgi:hypothetical protein